MSEDWHIVANNMLKKEEKREGKNKGRKRGRKEERRKGGKETFLPLFLGALLDYCGGGLVANSRPTLAIPWTVACQAPLSMGFSRQEYWGGLPFPSPLDYCTYKKKS